MKSRTLTWTTAMILFAALAATVRLAAQDQQNNNLQHYKLTVLGTLGGTFGAAVGINNRGWEDGNSTLTGNQTVHAALWRGGAVIDLGTLGGPNSNSPEGASLNNKGMVLGNSDTSVPDPNGEDFCFLGTNLICLPFVWQNGVMIALPTLGGTNAVAGGINNRGQIVGQSETPNTDPCSPFFLQVEAAIWQNGQVEELSPLPGDADGSAGAINDNGQVVGFSGCAVTGNVHALLWQHGTPIDLGNLGGVTGNFPFDINNRGQVVGQSDLRGDTSHHAFLWRDGVITDLGTLPGLPTSLANGINNKGQVVGFSQDANGDTLSSVAFLWQDGVLTDLNTLISPGSPLFLLEALGINDRGQIAGYGLLSNGEVHGYLLTPCDESHPGVEGCDYSIVEASAATGVSSAPAMPMLMSANQVPELRGPANPMLRRFGRGPGPWYRGMGTHPQK